MKTSKKATGKNAKNEIGKGKSKGPSEGSENPKQNSGLKNLGHNLQSKFSVRGDRAWRPTKPGGRNGQGKPT